jgi:TRAP-type mannitol/chloroaromatic compound transport system substrate-binding protein
MLGSLLDSNGPARAGSTAPGGKVPANGEVLSKMRRNDWLRSAAIAGVALCLLATFGAAADAQERVRWKLASSYSSTLDVVGKNIHRVIENIATMSDGNFEIQFNEPGALVPALEVFDAVSKGSVQASYTTPGFAAGRIPHLIFFASVLFGPSVNEYVAWVQHGGGYQLYEKGYGEHNIKGFQCGIVVAESSGWFRQPIESLDDLKGLKMRFLGLGAKVMGKLGVSTQLIAGADIYPALERGVIDATEFSYPSLDKSLGFYEIAKHNYFPGWHQQASFVELIMNRDAWNQLPASYQKMVEVACNDANLWLMGAAEASQGEAIAFHESQGVTVHQWPPEFIEAFRQAWEEVAQEEAAADPRFKEIYDHYTAFRETCAKWREIGYLQE